MFACTESCKKFRQQMNEFRECQKFTDVVLTCQEVNIVAHKNVLAASSPYFMAMFGGNFPESELKHIPMKDMDAHCLQTAIDFIYTGKLDINDGSARQLLSTATYLQLEDMCGLCVKFISDQLNIDNWLETKRFADQQNNDLLLSDVIDFVMQHFQEIMKTEGFCEITFEEFSAILSNKKLCVHSYNAVMLGIVRWVKHRLDERATKLLTLLRFIHPGSVSINLVRSIPLIINYEDSIKFLLEVAWCEDNFRFFAFVLDKRGDSVMDMLRIDFKSYEQVSLKPLPHSVLGPSLVAHNNILYSQGGCKSGHGTRDCYFYNVYDDEWNKLNQLLEARCLHRSVVVNDYLYAFGGYGFNYECLNSMECMDLRTNKSVYYEKMLDKRANMAASVHNNIIYIMGGDTVSDKTLSSMEQFDPRVGKWNKFPSMLNVNGYCTSDVIGDSIYCSECYSNFMERFDVRANRWEEIVTFENSCGTNIYDIFSFDKNLFGISMTEILEYDFETNEWMSFIKFREEQPSSWVVGIQMLRP